ncbi:MAG: glycosyltransferase, partial [bacterium]|nr:glycosyltransferase [bacterium]MDW8164082.1 glycosyltransferase [Candidatus Omnitrophota bacterium]
MKFLFKNNNLKNPKVSIILIDWSVRHSFHILEYLNKQTIDREKYEIIWIEYYDRKAKEIEEKLYKSIEKGFPILDKWVILEMPKNVYYHKHIMFNIGIILSQGEIICIPDSDAMVKETFVKTIIKEFEKDPNIVLHIDEIRNENKKFYPFNYPSFEEVLGKGRVLRWDGKTDIDKLKDPIHLLNYGACMCAKKEHLISIGGADEHIDYLGHICGVYEMTFRLKNYGLKEIWSKEEFLYHTWHPGESGSFDYMGPHDGLNMSTTALNTLITKRIYPLEENMGIKYLREKKNIDKETLLKMVLSDKRFGNWTIECLKSKNFEIPLFKKLRV